MSRLQDFLPKIKESNEKLEEQLKSLQKDDANPYDIEKVDEDKPFIEMVSSYSLSFFRFN